MKEEKYMIKSEYIEIMKPIITENGDGYFMRGTGVDIGSFSIVVIEFKHPNYGYFADFMLWIKSLHMNEWNAFPVVKCGDVSLNSFLKKYPKFYPLFEKRDTFNHLMKN